MLSIYEDGRCYDLIYPAKPKESVFWIGVARDFANTGPILETGCGTGYVCLPLAQAGYNACGLDLSASMLDEARRKAQVLGLEVDLLEHDMRSFDLGRQFSLILLPANAFGHLLTRQDQISYLDDIWRRVVISSSVCSSRIRSGCCGGTTRRRRMGGSPIQTRINLCM